MVCETLEKKVSKLLDKPFGQNHTQIILVHFVALYDACIH